MKIKVLGLATCFNRVNKTKACIESLIAANPDIQFEFIIVVTIVMMVRQKS